MIKKFILGFLLLFCIILLFNQKTYILAEEVPIYVETNDKFLIDLDTSKGIYFPGVLPGMNLKNSIIVTNHRSTKGQFKLEVEGINFVELSENIFNLDPEEAKEIDVIVNLPSNAEGVYEGKILVYVR